jgi:hypothetical protein
MKYGRREAPRAILKAWSRQRIKAQRRDGRLRDHAETGMWQCARHDDDRCLPRHAVQSDAITQGGGLARGSVAGGARHHLVPA